MPQASALKASEAVGQRPLGTVWVRRSQNRAGVTTVNVEGLAELDLLHERIAIPWCHKHLGKRTRVRLGCRGRERVLMVTGDIHVELSAALWTLSPKITAVAIVDAAGRVAEVVKPTEEPPVEQPDCSDRIARSVLDSLLSRVVKTVEESRRKEAKRLSRLSATQVGAEKAAARRQQLAHDAAAKAKRDAVRRERQQEAEELCEAVLSDLRALAITGDDLTHVFDEQDSRSQVAPPESEAEAETCRAAYAAQAKENAAKAAQMASAMPIGEKSATVFYKGAFHKKVWENAHQKRPARKAPCHVPSPFLKLTPANLRRLGDDTDRAARSPSHMSTSTVYGSTLCESTTFDFGRASLHLKCRMFQRGISIEEMESAATHGSPILLKTRRDSRGHGKSGTRVYLFNDIVYLMNKSGTVGITAWRSETFAKWVRCTQEVVAASVPPQGGPLGAGGEA